MTGVPVARMTMIGLAIVAMFLVAGVVLIVTGHETEGANAMATATGVAIGTGASTGVAVYVNGRDTSSPSSPSTSPKL